MNQLEKANYFASLHVKHSPVVLFNIWDAGGAQAIEKAGAKAVATGSWSVAAAHGYPDGEQIPIDLVEVIAARICAATELPVSIDFEGGYSEDPDEIARNVRRIVRIGAVGINFEDQIIGSEGLYQLPAQVERIEAIRNSATGLGVPLFINARTDLFLQAGPEVDHADLIDSALERAEEYERAGASGLFLPGLIDENLIAQVCDHTRLPVNVMMMDGAPPIDRLADVGVARVSFGPSPYLDTLHALSEHFERYVG